MTNADALPPLVDAPWLSDRLHEPGLRLADASWHLPGSGRDAAVEFRQAHIPGAVFFDIDRIVDTDTDLAHMLPAASDFASAVGALGIGSGDRVIVYDSHGLYSATRAWWMLRTFGHDQIAVLDGGLRAWQAAGLPVESGEATPAAPARFEARLVPERVWRLEDIRRNLDTGAACILDARPADRFAGDVPEPRAGLRRGHIPGSLNIPFDRLTDPETGRMRSREELEQLFAGTGDNQIVCSCGSGVTACALAFALHLLGREDVAVYDGAWTEWGGRSDTPVET